MPVERGAAEALGHEYVSRVRSLLFRHALAADPDDVGRLARGGLWLRFSGDLESLRRWVTLGLVRLPSALLIVSAALLAIGWNAPVLAGAVTGVVCLGSVAAARVGRPLQQSLRRQRRARSRLATNVGEKLDALRTIQVSGRGHREARRIDRQGAELSRHGAARGRASAALRFWSQLTNGMSAAVVLWIGALEVGAGRATAGDVVAAMTVLGLIGPPVRELARAFEVWQAMRITRGKLTAFLALGRRRIDVQSPVQTQGLLELQDVRVGGSPPRTARVVPGTLIALVGENGAGKSTWLRVLAGLQAAEGGRVLLDGADVARMDAEVRRKHVGLAAPDLPLVAGSVSKNVRYRWPRPTPEALGEALHVAGIGSLGAAGGEALGRRVGELGRELSSGERARVGLARAILGHPALLLLDEVDAHLDGPSRARLAQWLRGYPGVVVVASHDPEIVAAAKQVWRVELPAPRNLPASAALLLGIALSIAAGVRPAEARTLQEVSEAASPAEVQGLEVDIGRRGLVLGHEAQDWGLRLGGRLQLDAADFDSDEVEVDDRIDWRRGRLRLSDSFGEHWRARAEYDFLGVVEGWTSVYGRWQSDPWRVTVGNQVTPFGLEGQIASDQTTFLERSLSRALTPSLLAGVSAGREFTSGSLDFGVFGDAFDRDPARRADGFGLVARSTRELLDFAPRSALAGQVHFGASMERREPDSDARLRIRSRPESGLADRRLVDTRTIDGADSLSGLGVELAVDVGPAALQAEWVGQRVDRPGDDAELHGGYVQFSVFATGERRRYDPRRGLFRAVEPSSSHGALELAARYSWLDLTDEPVTGGEQADVTLGASWYLDRNWRLSLEWIEAAARPDRDGIDVDLTIVQLRLQVDF